MAKIKESDFDSIKTKVNNKTKEDWEKLKTKVIDNASAFFEFSSETTDKDIVKLLEDTMDHVDEFQEPLKLAIALLPYAIEECMLQGIKAKNFFNTSAAFEIFMAKEMAYNSSNDAGVLCEVCGAHPKKYFIKGKVAKWFRFNNTIQKGVCIHCIETESEGIEGKEGFVKEWHKGNKPAIPAPTAQVIASSTKKAKG